MCACVCVCVCFFLFIFSSTFRNLKYVCVCVYVRLLVHFSQSWVCVRVCVYLLLHFSWYEVCAYIHTCMCTCTCTLCNPKYMHIYIYVRVCVCMCTYCNLKNNIHTNAQRQYMNTVMVWWWEEYLSLMFLDAIRIAGQITQETYCPRSVYFEKQTWQ